MHNYIYRHRENSIFAGMNELIRFTTQQPKWTNKLSVSITQDRQLGALALIRIPNTETTKERSYTWHLRIESLTC